MIKSVTFHRRTSGSRGDRFQEDKSAMQIRRHMPPTPCPLNQWQLPALSVLIGLSKKTESGSDARIKDPEHHGFDGQRCTYAVERVRCDLNGGLSHHLGSVVCIAGRPSRTAPLKPDASAQEHKDDPFGGGGAGNRHAVAD